MSRTCLAIFDPRYDTECGKPAHLDTCRCIEHLPEAPPPRVVQTTHTRGLYEVGLFCTCLQRWTWETVKARSLKAAREASTPIIRKLFQQSAERWDIVRLQARDAGAAQRKQSIFFEKLP